MRGVEQIVSDSKLNVPVSSVEPTNAIPRPWNSPRVIQESLELPVQRPCWYLRELGIETTASTANRKNIGDTAGIAIHRATLSRFNDQKFQKFSRLNPSVVTLSDRSVSICVPIPNAHVTAKSISDAFMAIIDEVGIKPQPAKWAQSQTAEEVLIEAMTPLESWTSRIKSLSGQDVLKRLMEALSWDAQTGLTMDESTYQQFYSAANLLLTYGDIQIIDEKPVFKGVLDPKNLAARSALYFDAEHSCLWKSKETKAYYERCQKAADPEASVFDMMRGHGR